MKEKKKGLKRKVVCVGEGEWWADLSYFMSSPESRLASFVKYINLLVKEFKLVGHLTQPTH